MLESIKLENFQAHRRLEVSFDPAITTIVGPSDVGKSSILRALLWVCLNQPGGDGFIRSGAGFSRVTLRVDGHTIIRTRGRRNLYSRDGEEFTALGLATVPDAIRSLLNISIANFQQQIDPPFWFTDTPGQVSKNLNSIVNLQAIDEVLAAIGTEVRTAKAEVEFTAARVGESAARVSDLKWIVGYDRKLRAAEAAVAKRDELTRKQSELQILVMDMQRLGHAQRKAERRYERGRKLVELCDHWFTAAAKVLKLRELISSAKQPIRRVPDLGPLTEAFRNKEKLQSRKVALTATLNQYREADTWATKSLQKAASLQEDFSKLANILCPTCGQMIQSPSSSPTSTAPTAPRSSGRLSPTGTPPCDGHSTKSAGSKPGGSARSSG